VAVCALVLPGVSGAFLLLTFGLYEPTSEAVRTWDLGYLGVFILGMIVGLSLFVKGLQWLLEHRRRVTLAAMTGLIIGALRALWPWQTDERALLAPDTQVVLAVALAVLGAGVVLTIVVIERRTHRARGTQDHPSVDHGVFGTTRGRHARKTP
jgi:putative membrane protein